MNCILKWLGWLFKIKNPKKIKFVQHDKQLLKLDYSVDYPVQLIYYFYRWTVLVVQIELFNQMNSINRLLLIYKVWTNIDHFLYCSYWTNVFFNQLHFNQIVPVIFIIK